MRVCTHTRKLSTCTYMLVHLYYVHTVDPLPTLAPSEMLSTNGLKSLCQIEATRFLSHAYLCFSTGYHGDSDIPAAGDGGVVNIVHDTLAGLLSDLTRPTHLQLVSVCVSSSAVDRFECADIWNSSCLC